MIAKEILRKVRRIQILTSRKVTDLMAGQYSSVFKGRGMEFKEVRHYQPGDDVRLIDLLDRGACTLAGIEMLSKTPTWELFKLSMTRAFIEPWQVPQLANVVLVLMVVGAGLRDEHRRAAGDRGPDEPLLTKGDGSCWRTEPNDIRRPFQRAAAAAGLCRGTLRL